MVEIGGRPILWHIMKHFAHHGFHEFFVALGYKWGRHQALHPGLLPLKRQYDRQPLERDALMHHKKAEDWVVHLHDTGLQVNTGGRVNVWSHFSKIKLF